MTNTNPSEVQAGNIPWPPGHEPLWAQIKDWARAGLSPELIIALVMSNPTGTGAMDVASQKVKNITDQYTQLCDVQSDLITIDSILSKIESQLGTSNNPTIDPNDKTLLKELNDLKTAYQKLFGNGTDSDGGDFAKLQEAAKTDPDLNMVISQIQTFQTDLTGSVKVDPNVTKPFPGGQYPGGKTSFNFGNDLNQWDGQSLDPTQPGFIADVAYLAAEHYDANHTTTNPTPMAAATGGSDPSDILKTWWGDGDSSQSVASGQSQQDTTRVNSLMQVLQGFDNTGQQILQAAASQKTQMVTNEKTQ